MDDTSPKIAEKMREMFRKKTASERIHMSFDMYALSKRLVTSAILRENPHISPLDLKKQLFLKFYGNDYSEEKKQKILLHFDHHA
jgi:hypothetical protein